MAKITYADKVALNQNPNIPDINKVNDTDMNMIKNVVNNNETKVLLAVSSSAPATCDTGDIYFNTTDNLIYTATATDTWSTTGVAPTENTIYIEFTSQTAYAYDGATLVSVGGGASGGGETLPIGSEIDFDGSVSDIPDGWELVGNNYSTDEIKTGKTWIDGKPIYRKVYTGIAGAGGNWASFPLNITNLNEITDMRFKCGNPNEMYTSNFYVSTVYQIMFRLGTSEVQYLLGSGYSNLPYKVTVEYTKTTD